jgi:hypothetical protein
VGGYARRAAIYRVDQAKQKYQDNALVNSKGSVRTYSAAVGVQLCPTLQQVKDTN